MSALEAVSDYGREARLIQFDGLPHTYPCESSREFCYVGERR